MAKAITQVQLKRTDKQLSQLSDQKLKYGEPALLTNDNNKALIIGNDDETDFISEGEDYYIPITNKDTFDKGYMVKGVDYVTAGRLSGSTIGHYATAEGQANTASANYAHAEGFENTASGQVSHAEGNQTTSSGQMSHTEGNNTTASGVTSHAEGFYTEAAGRSQHVFGEFNEIESVQSSTSKGTYVEIVGNGTSTNARSNARALDWDGNEYLQGRLYVNVNDFSNPQSSGDKVATEEFVWGIAEDAGVIINNLSDSIDSVANRVTTIEEEIPSISGTTYTFTGGQNNSFKVKPSNSTEQTVTINLTAGGFGNQSSNVVLAGPSSGVTNLPTFRKLVDDDIPNIAANKIISDGTVKLPIGAIPTGTTSGTVSFGNHVHGNITNSGDITMNKTIANGDRIVINDEENSRITNSSITFDGSTTTQFLSKKGSWETPTVPAATTDNLGGIKIGYTSTANNRAVELNTNSQAFVNIPSATTITNGLMSGGDKAKLDSVTSGAQPNQNAYSSIKVGSTILTSSSTTDTIELKAGSNVTLTADNSSNPKSITIASTGGGGVSGVSQIIAGNGISVNQNTGSVQVSTKLKSNVTVSAQSTVPSGSTSSDRLYSTIKDSDGYLSTYVPWKDYTFDGTYDAATNKAATVSSVTTRLNTRLNRTTNVNANISGTESNTSYMARGISLQAEQAGVTPTAQYVGSIVFTYA